MHSSRPQDQSENLPQGEHFETTTPETSLLGKRGIRGESEDGVKSAQLGEPASSEGAEDKSGTRERGGGVNE